MTKINGGFPPIKYCAPTEVKQQLKKERFFANAPKQNINIRELLTDSKKKKVITVETNDDDFDKVEYI